MFKCRLEHESYKYIYGVQSFAEEWVDDDKKMTTLCARNDWSAVQLLLQSHEPMLVSVDDSPCFYKKGPATTYRVELITDGLRHEDSRVQLIGLVQDDDSQYKADVLLDQSNIYVEANKTQPIWIEIPIGDRTSPGIYHPIIRIYKKNVFEDEVLIKELSYEIEVVDFTLPIPKNYNFYLDLWQHNSNIARKYDVKLWSEEHFTIIDRYIDSLARLGQKAITVLVSEIPWSGQNALINPIDPSDLYEYSMVKVFKKENKFSYDFSIMNRYIELCQSYGIDDEIEVFGLVNIWLKEKQGFGNIIEDYDDGIRVRYYDQDDGCYKFMRTKSELMGYIRALEQNFIDKEWVDKVRVIADEPSDLETYLNRLKTINEEAPHLSFKAAINHVEFMEESIPNLKDYCPALGCVTEKLEEFKRIKSECDGTVSYYVCCGPKSPNTFICSPLMESRIIPWVALLIGTDGFLRWNYTVWPDNPLEKITYAYPSWPAGDTNFVYPGKNGYPMLSLRYKNLQRGIRDFEVLKAFEKNGGSIEGYLQKVFKKSHPLSQKYFDDGCFSMDYETYEAIIKEIVHQLK